MDTAGAPGRFSARQEVRSTLPTPPLSLPLWGMGLFHCRVCAEATLPEYRAALGTCASAQLVGTALCAHLPPLCSPQAPRCLVPRRQMLGSFRHRHVLCPGTAAVAAEAGEVERSYIESRPVLSWPGPIRHERRELPVGCRVSDCASWSPAYGRQLLGSNQNWRGRGGSLDFESMCRAHAKGEAGVRRDENTVWGGV